MCNLEDSNHPTHETSKLFLRYCNTHGYNAQNHRNAMSNLYPPKYTEMTYIILRIEKSIGENTDHGSNGKEP
jgi:hypothetical protein